jgi:hypothetical protein
MHYDAFVDVFQVAQLPILEKIDVIFYAITKPSLLGSRHFYVQNMVFG